MKNMAAVLVGLLLVLGVVSHSQAGAFQGVKVQDIKIGGGFLWNDKVNDPLDTAGGGLHASVDFTLLPQIVLTPFYEFSRRNSTTTTLIGGEFHYNIPVGKDRGKDRRKEQGMFYVGPGFGVADAAGATEFHINGIGGFKYNLTDRVGFFVQGKYTWAADDLLNGVTAHSGLCFR